MKMKTLFAAAAASSLAIAPVALNAESFDRTVAPVAGESELEGENGILIAILAAAAVIAGIIIIADDDDDSVSA
jgi:hypothetical protein